MGINAVFRIRQAEKRRIRQMTRGRSDWKEKDYHKNKKLHFLKNIYLFLIFKLNLTRHQTKFYN